MTNLQLANVKEERSRLIQAILDLVYTKFLDLLASKNTRLCKLRSNEAKCDIANLGCLMMEFQGLSASNPNFVRWAGSAVGLRARINRIPRIGSHISQNPASSIANSHAKCDVGSNLFIKISRLIDAIKGFHLPSL